MGILYTHMYVLYIDKRVSCSDTAPTNKICRRVPLVCLSPGRLRTRSCHEWESLISNFVLQPNRLVPSLLTYSLMLNVQKNRWLMNPVAKFSSKDIAIASLPFATPPGCLLRLPSPYPPPGCPSRLPPLRQCLRSQSHTRTLPGNLVTTIKSEINFGNVFRFCELLGRTWHPRWIIKTSSSRSTSNSATALRPYHQSTTVPSLHKGLKKTWTQSLLL